MGDVKVGIDLPVDDDDVVRAARRVGNLSSELRQLGSGTRLAVTNFRSMAGGITSSAGTTRSQVASMTSGIRSSVAGLTTGAVVAWAAGIGVAVMGAVSAVLSLGGAIGRATYSFAKLLIDSGSFQETSLASLEVLLKSKTLAAQVYKDARDFAGATPFDTREVVSGYKQLLSVGFGVDTLKRTFAALGDLAASTGDPTALGRAITVMGQIRSLGKLTTEDLNQLSNMSLSKADVLTEVAKLMGTDLATASKDLERGAITSATATEAIIRAVERTRGGMMDVQSGTLAGLLSTLASKPFEFIDDLKTAGGGVSKFYDTVKASVSGALKWLEQSDVKMGIANGLNTAAIAMTKLMAIGKAFLGGVWKGLTGEQASFGTLAESIEKMDVAKLSAGFAEVGQKVGTLAGDLATLSTNLVKLSENESLAFVVRLFGGFAIDSLKAVIAVSEFVAAPFLRLIEVLGWAIGKFREFKAVSSSILPSFATGGGFDLGLGTLGSSFGMGLPQPASGSLPPIVPSVSMPVPAGGGERGGDSITNYYQFSQSVSGGAFPEEIARIARNEVQRALKAAGG